MTALQAHKKAASIAFGLGSCATESLICIPHAPATVHPLAPALVLSRSNGQTLFITDADESTGTFVMIAPTYSTSLAES